jgi:hypothetical protein
MGAFHRPILSIDTLRDSIQRLVKWSSRWQLIYLTAHPKSTDLPADAIGESGDALVRIAPQERTNETGTSSFAEHAFRNHFDEFMNRFMQARRIKSAHKIDAGVRRYRRFTHVGVFRSRRSTRPMTGLLISGVKYRFSIDMAFIEG